MVCQIHKAILKIFIRVKGGEFRQFPYSLLHTFGNNFRRETTIENNKFSNRKTKISHSSSDKCLKGINVRRVT